MITFRELHLIDAEKIQEIDRSERIHSIYQMEEGVLKEIKAGHECPNWSVEEVERLTVRFRSELEKGGKAFGAFDQSRLVGFGVLAHKWRGKNKDQLQVDLMYVSREYRRKGIGTRIMDDLSREAKLRGAKSLYISSTETQSAYNFYRNCGSDIAEEVDEELFELEPLDIHLVKEL